ncbi:glycosyltransferase family 2 protein, partial [Acidobacteriota bacterium]
ILTHGCQWNLPFFTTYLERRSGKEAFPDWVSGACLLARKDLVQEAGYIDENFFMFAEEVDLCRRIVKLGYRIFYYPDVSIIHLRGQSSSTNLNKIIYEYRRSQLYFYKKHCNMQSRLALRIYLLVKFGLFFLYCEARRLLSRPDAVQDVQLAKKLFSLCLTYK